MTRLNSGRFSAFCLRPAKRWNLWALLAVGAALGCPPAGPTPTGSPMSGMHADNATVTTGAASEKVVSLFITTQMHNTLEPCGCTSEPLGDVSRIAALLHSAPGRSLLIDAGGLRYKQLRLPREKQHQARLQADFLEETWRTLGSLTMLQPSDLLGSDGVAELKGSTRLVSNLSGLPADQIQSEAIRTLAEVRIGLFGIADPDATWPPPLQVSDPIAAATVAVLRLRAQKVDGVVAITGLRREAARRLARRVSGIDLVIAGGDPDLLDGVEQAEQVGSTLLVVPAIEGQRVVRVDLHLSPTGSAPAWTVIATAKQIERQLNELRQRRDAATERLAKLRSDPQAEPAFLQTTADEVDRLTRELDRAKTPPSPPNQGYATVELLPIHRKLPRDPAIAKRMTELDRVIGEANLQALSGPPPPPPAGQPHYVGLAGCQGACHFHDDAIDFWQKTRHVTAFPTLVQVGKERSYDCVSCHATGFDEVGGSNLWTLAAWQRKAATVPPPTGPDLRGVQCEVCHGPGSLHVSAPSKHPIPIARPVQDRCLTCHTKEHSDTFDFVAYLRDILGPGHGAEKRTALGNGPTGHELRSAALKKHSAPH